jgi:hypothetical protein
LILKFITIMRCDVPIAVTIFGVAKGDAPATFCYAFLRLVRGHGSYPVPTLPMSAQKDGVQRMLIEGSDGLDLLTWDNILEESAHDSIQTELDSGRFSPPIKCPIDSGNSLTGQPFGPVIILEDNDKASISGAGVLYVKGIAVDYGIDRVRHTLDNTVGPAKTPAILSRLIELISEQSGLGLFSSGHRRIGVVDQFYRAMNVVEVQRSLFDVSADKYNLQTKEPMRRVKIRRKAASLDKIFKFHVTLKNFDEILLDVLLDMPAGQSEITVEANSHVTDIILVVFDQLGQMVDRLSGAFIQGFNFGITAQGRVDELPPILSGVPKSTDLEKRTRIQTSAFDGPSAVNRSRGLGALRQHQLQISTLIGNSGWSGENMWFEFGGEGQIEVIRWVKGKLEQPGISKAYLVDPYLGSNALQRVIARQGNENITLTILVSPGGIDPDANTVDAKATSSYLDRLVTTANEWSGRLCGLISIVHIRRGEGAKQAFHDRHLILVDSQGVPNVYLFSNSLSKAAGDWPFAICQLNRVISWQVYYYVLALIEGKDGDRDIYPVVIWQSGDPTNARLTSSQVESQPPFDNAQPEWVKSANRFLQDLFSIIIQNSDYEKNVGAIVDSFIGNWSQSTDTEVLANNLFRVVGYREEVIIFISSRFAAGTDDQREVACRLDGMLLDQFLVNLPRDNRKASGSLPLRGDRSKYLRHIGKTIANMSSPTNFIRDKLNPILHALVQLIEVQRFDFGLTMEALETGICLVSVGLEVAISAKTTKESFRVGMATDYIHWLGRLIRSDAATSRFDSFRTLPKVWREDLSFAARQVLDARGALGEKLKAPIKRVSEDPLVLITFKNMLVVSIAP